MLPSRLGDQGMQGEPGMGFRFYLIAHFRLEKLMLGRWVLMPLHKDIDDGYTYRTSCSQEKQHNQK